MPSDLKTLSQSSRQQLVEQLVEELLIDARSRLHRWRSLTNQPAQIDTGYVSQHLVSIVTGQPGGGFRGKGDDLADGSEIKAANYLDAFDNRGASSPRWNLSVTQASDLDKYLNVPFLYFVVIDLPPQQLRALKEYESQCVRRALVLADVPVDLRVELPRSFDVLQDFFASKASSRLAKVFPGSVTDRLIDVAEEQFHETGERRLQITNACRIRVWRINPREHTLFRRRYLEWTEKKARPKFDQPSVRGNRQDANFQLFPPRNGTNESFARHGSTRSGELPPIHVRLQDVEGAQLVLNVIRAESGEYKFG